MKIINLFREAALRRSRQLGAPTEEDAQRMADATVEQYKLVSPSGALFYNSEIPDSHAEVLIPRLIASMEAMAASPELRKRVQEQCGRIYKGN